MLLQKSKFDSGDIVSLKLTSGEEIVGKFVSEDMMEFVQSRYVSYDTKRCRYGTLYGYC